MRPITRWPLRQRLCVVEGVTGEPGHMVTRVREGGFKKPAGCRVATSESRSDSCGLLRGEFYYLTSAEPSLCHPSAGHCSPKLIVIHFVHPSQFEIYSVLGDDIVLFITKLTFTIQDYSI